jgi:hypothetical protein
MNDNDEIDDVRQPDEVKREILINYNYDLENDNYLESHTLDDDFDAILELSKNEFNSAQEKQAEKDMELIYNQQKEERQNKFNIIKIQFTKMIIFDRENVNCYELVLSIIELYEIGSISVYILNKSSYNDIFTILKTIRLPNEEIDNLKKLILCE